MPDVQALSRIDKIRLMQALAQELDGDIGAWIEADKSYPVWSPFEAHAAADVLMKLLQQERGQP